ncbi:hypothetical protein C8R44DRAFT_846323 [Mycena epipterygia]|nr:hypothetical protein C8R44DRAFT_846323 [Mycena epipterygia]
MALRRSSGRVSKPSARAIASSSSEIIDSDPDLGNDLAPSPEISPARHTHKKTDDDQEEEEEEEEEEDGEGQAEQEDEEDEEDEDESEVEIVPKKRRKTQTPPIEEDIPISITFNISIFVPKEMRKSVKKRLAAASGFIKILDDVAYHRFNHKVPRHVVNYVELDDTESYNHMLESAKKCKDPVVNLAIEMLNVTDYKKFQREEEIEDKTTKKPKQKTKIPSENDILPANAILNSKIAQLRTKWTCHANDGSDYCWVSGEQKEHIPLGHPHFNMWAAAWAQGACDDERPPNHAIFKTKGGGADGLAAPTLLQRRIAANQPQPTSTAPVINNNFTLPDRLLDLFHPAEPSVPVVHIPAVPAPDHVMLLPPSTKVGDRMSIPNFCNLYDLDQSIADKLTANGYKNASVLYLIKLAELEKMDFLPGEIAELRDAVRQWALPL